MYTQETELGRRAKIADWRSFHRDRLLSVLYSMRNGGLEELTLDAAKLLTGLSKSSDVADLVEFMQREKLVEMTIRNTVAITERGVRWVDESPRRP